MDTHTDKHTQTHTHTHTHARTHTHSHTHTHIHVWGGFRESDFASVTGDTILPHFPVCIHMIIPIYLAMNVRVQRKKHKKQQSDFSPGSGDKIECSNKRRGHPIPCILTPRLNNKRFSKLGISPLPKDSPLTWDEVCVCPRKPPYTYATHTHTHTQTHTHTHTHTFTFSHTQTNVQRQTNTKQSDQQLIKLNK